MTLETDKVRQQTEFLNRLMKLYVRSKKCVCIRPFNAKALSLQLFRGGVGDQAVD